MHCDPSSGANTDSLGNKPDNIWSLRMMKLMHVGCVCACALLIGLAITGCGRSAQQPAHIDELARLQRELLDAAARATRPGGTLVYSVCTISPREGPSRPPWTALLEFSFMPSRRSLWAGLLAALLLLGASVSNEKGEKSGSRLALPCLPGYRSAKPEPGILGASAEAALVTWPMKPPDRLPYDVRR